MASDKKDKNYPKLSNNMSADVVIIGGGMAGVLNAYILSKVGKKVILIEEKKLGSGATGDTTAFITKVIDSNLAEIADLFGKDAGKLVWESGQAAIEEFDKIIKKESIECDFVRCPNYLFARTKAQLKDLEEEEKTYKRFNIKASLKKDSGLNFPNYGYLEVPNQAKFSAAKFVEGLSKKAALQGALIYENTSAVSIHEEQGFITVMTDKGRITADDLIIATYQPITNKKTHLKKGMYKSYVFEVKIPKNSFKEAIYEDNGNPYYYFRIDPGEDYDQIVIGGEDHRRELTSKILEKKSFKGLEKFLKKLMQKRPYVITNRWTGPILEPSDGLALIGEIKPDIYVATGFSGNGMTYSMISALIFKDLILNQKSSKKVKKNSWAKVYDPKRTLLNPKRLAVKAKDYAEEFFLGAVKNLLSS